MPISSEVTAQSLSITFNSPAKITGAEITPPIPTKIEGTSVIFLESPVPGVRYALRATAEAIDNPSLTENFTAFFYGHNPNPARLAITAVAFKHDKKRPEYIELTVLSAGTLAGETLYLGIPGNSDARFVFTSNDPVKRGEVVTVLCEKDPFPGGNFKWSFGQRLPDARGIITLAEQPDDNAPIVDYVVYRSSLTPNAQFEERLKELSNLRQESVVPVDSSKVTSSRFLGRTHDDTWMVKKFASTRRKRR